ncbi:hypothetical protein [Mesorhizobium sp. KR9-304]|uniref:hypothetical protein n=1 Tax=Mesorhizobium sp. KR9-304 TaxID=3156614 RepID=UPI0032B354A1
MRREILTMLAVLTCQPAFASGGIHCSADAGGVTIDVGGGVTHGMGGPLFSFEGKLEIADKAIAADLGETAFAREHVAQYWLDGEDLRLLLYREREGDKPHGYVELTIQTTARGGDDGEGFYDGRYKLSVFDATEENGGEGVTVEREGEVVCSAE